MKKGERQDQAHTPRRVLPSEVLRTFRSLDRTRPGEENLWAGVERLVDRVKRQSLRGRDPHDDGSQVGTGPDQRLEDRVRGALAHLDRIHQKAAVQGKRLEEIRRRTAEIDASLRQVSEETRKLKGERRQG